MKRSGMRNGAGWSLNSGTASMETLSPHPVSHFAALK
jgi:hypothetical protein